MADIDSLAKRYELLSIDEETTKAYGTIKAALRKKGKPIPENDIWISAIAQRHNLAIAPRDKHFKEVEGLTIKHW